MNSHRQVMQQLSEARPEALDLAESNVRVEDIITQPRTLQLQKRRTSRLVLAGAVPVAAALIVLVLTQTSMPQPGLKVLPANSSAAVQPMTAEQLLLAAAEQTLRTTPESGKYWVVKDEHGSVFPAGSKSNRYYVLQRSNSEAWLTAGDNHFAWSAGQFLGAAPYTAADEAAWRKDGSPTQWLRRGDNKSTDEIIKAAPGNPHSRKGSQWQLAPVLGGQIVTLAEIKALPTDAKALRDWLIAGYKRNPSRDFSGHNERLMWDGRSILMGTPGVSPQVRAAAYRMLAGVSGVRSLGETKDANGRPGYAIAWDSHAADGSYDQRLIFSPSSGETLAWETHELRPGHNGRLLGYSLMISQGWTNDPLPE